MKKKGKKALSHAPAPTADPLHAMLEPTGAKASKTPKVSPKAGTPSTNAKHGTPKSSVSPDSQKYSKSNLPPTNVPICLNKSGSTGYIRACTELIVGKTFDEIDAAKLQYRHPNSPNHKGSATTERWKVYRFSDYIYDLNCGWITISKAPVCTKLNAAQYADMHLSQQDVQELLVHAFITGGANDMPTCKEAKANPIEWPHWHKAELKEIADLIEQGMLKIVSADDPKVKGKKLYSMKLVLKKKPPANSEPECYKV